ncbi:hypothetical protein MAP00_007036 [Monascus purpureus]|nr:hypothetical protein MAP00_007036 [Monascus purpureus]
MHVNRKFDRFKQWAGERMGGEVKTNVSDDFKARETEMTTRHEGLDRVHKSATAYIKSISKKSEGEDKERILPVGHLGGSLISYGEGFDGNSKYGQCLIMFGRAEERLARIQESYAAQASATWLESQERNLTQLKEYQSARKKLDTRRLAYDTSLSKVQKAKKEDYRIEEELRVQRVKYEESSDDVYRRMEDIKESDEEAVVDLASFLDAQLAYYDKCREVLLQLKSDWPVASPSRTQTPSGRRTGRPRANTAHSFYERYEPLHEEPLARESRSTARSSPLVELPVREGFQAGLSSQRPILNRTSTFEGPMQLRQEQSQSPSLQRLPRAGSVSYGPRPSVSRSGSYADVSDEGDPFNSSTTDLPYRGSVSSQATSHSPVSPSSSTTNLNSTVASKKAPPPPPPLRAKKPPPPPPPMKRFSNSTSNV